MTKVYTHPGQSQMQVKVVLASKSTDPKVPPIYTIRMRYPRIIHAEVMTHRVFSRNARSSRAVPVSRMIEEIRNKPFVPWHWGKNQKGMQAEEECQIDLACYIPAPEANDEVTNHLGFRRVIHSREDAWIVAAKQATQLAKSYMDAGYHKQIANRLLEPFMWIDVLITSTEWENFLWLRDHKDAEPHLQDLARLVKQAISEAEYQTLEPGEWHLPYIDERDWAAATSGDTSQHQVADSPLGGIEFLRKLSASRCARMSYAPFDGDASYEREIERYNSLVSSDRIHASPLEHQASPDQWEDAPHYGQNPYWIRERYHGNLTGWVQYRKLISNENHS